MMNFIVILLLSACCLIALKGFQFEKIRKESEEKFTNQNVTDFIKDIYMEMRYFPLGEVVEDIEYFTYRYLDGEYSKPEVFKAYFIRYMNEEVYDYLFYMFGYQIYNGKVIVDGELERSRYEFNIEKESIITDIKKNRCYIKSPFIYWGLDEKMEKEDIGQLCIEQQKNGSWKVIFITQWFNDLLYYDLREDMTIFWEYGKKDLEGIIQKYGTDSSERRISMKIIRANESSNNGSILPYSNKYEVTESDLKPLTKISAILAYYEITARYGDTFQGLEPFIKRYFLSRCPWYIVNENNYNEDCLSELEKRNQEIIRKYIDSF